MVIAVIVLAAVFLIVLVFSYVIVSINFKRVRPKAKPQGNVGKWQDYAAANRDGRAFIASLPHEKIEIKSFDGLTLRATYLPAEKPSGRVAIAFHGHHSNAMLNMAMFARYYHSRGFDLILPDNRAHGDSDGKYIGFAFWDRFDVRDWAKYAVSRFGKSCRILLHGVSMGSSSVISASAEELPEQVFGIVADCGYSSAWDQFLACWKLHSCNFPVPAFPVIHIVNLMTRIFAGYSLKQSSPKEFIKKAKVPFLFIHGDDDDYVPTWMVLKICQNCPTAYTVEIFERAYHAACYPADKRRYESLVDVFCEKYGGS